MHQKKNQLHDFNMHRQTIQAMNKIANYQRPLAKNRGTIYIFMTVSLTILISNLKHSPSPVHGSTIF
jgi:hypothetical protein